MSKIPSKSNITIPAGQVYFMPDGYTRPFSLGHCKKFAWTPSIETLPINVSTSGRNQKIGEVETLVEASVSLTLQEMRADVLAMATAGKVAAYTQTAGTQTMTFEDVKDGDFLELNGIKLSDIEVQVDGALGINGTHYIELAESGSITARGDAALIEVSFSRPAIVESDNKAVIEILNSVGLRGIFTVVPLNDTGKRFKLQNFRAVIRPTAEIPLNSDGTALAEIEMEGSAEYNEAMPLRPWGELIELN